MALLEIEKANELSHSRNIDNSFAFSSSELPNLS